MQPDVTLQPSFHDITLFSSYFHGYFVGFDGVQQSYSHSNHASNKHEYGLILFVSSISKYHVWVHDRNALPLEPSTAMQTCPDVIPHLALTDCILYLERIKIVDMQVPPYYVYARAKNSNEKTHLSVPTFKTQFVRLVQLHATNAPKLTIEEELVQGQWKYYRYETKNQITIF